MWVYEKKLQYPVKIKNPDAKMAKYIMDQYGGPDGELAASLRYLSQRFSMPNDITKGVLNDIGNEELAHFEMIGTIIHQLTRNLTKEQIEAAGFGGFFITHDSAVYPAGSNGMPFTAAYLQSKGDVLPT